MVKLRLKRMGKKHKPIYKIVAADSRSPRDGKFIESLGSYNPNPDPMEIKLNTDRVLYWLKTGAIPTDTVRNLFSKEGVILRWHLEKKGKTSEQIEEELNKFFSEKAAKLDRAKARKIRRKESKAKRDAEAKQPAA
ncbi:MAG TPA: 30S ribosomal protein S16 [Ignavibacteria bacterium]|nr:30S ribosomal protein S16 [Ignavibacteria bacterium]